MRVRRRHLGEVEAERHVNRDPRGSDRLQQLLGHLRTRLGQAAEVLDAVHTGSDRVPYSGQRVRVGQHLQPGLVPGRDEGRQLRFAELRGEHIGPGRDHAAAGHHLQHVDPAGDMLGDLVAHAIHAQRHPAEEVAMPVRDGQRRPRRAHPGQPGEGAGLERPVPAVPEVQDGGDPARGARGQGFADLRVQLFVCRGAGPLQRPDIAVRHQVHVAVDQPRQQRPGVRRDVGVARRLRVPRLDTDDPLAIDQHRAGAQEGGSVVHLGCPQRLHAH